MNDDSLFEMAKHLPPLPYLHGEPAVSGCIRQCPEHFIVNEVLGFEPSGEGEHYFFKIRKREWNTTDAAQALAKVLGVHPRCVSWSGLKDKHAVTTQWLGVHSPKPLVVCIDTLNHALPNATVLECVQHSKKLRIGSHKGNQFELTVSALEGGVDALMHRLERVREEGVPNYFGEQRFGRAHKNLQLADAVLFKGQRVSRQKKSLALSAARSFVFNQMVAQPLREGVFLTPSIGQTLMLGGSHSVFDVTDVQEAAERLASGDVHPVQSLLGDGVGAPEYEHVQQALEKQGVKSQWRAARVMPKNMSWRIDEAVQQLVLNFELPRGAYATSVLRECVSAQDVSLVR